MASLAIFDFDRTIVDDDSDVTIFNMLKEKQPPPEWEAGINDWTLYMSDVFAHVYSAGLSEEEILCSIRSMKPVPGVEELITTLAAEGWDIIILSDANSVFVHHWLKTHGLLEHITLIVTNGAFFKNGRLYIEPCMKQDTCARCPSNLCKSLALAQWCARNSYDKMVYCGDGRNDYCPATKLPAQAIVFPRRGYPLHELLQSPSAHALVQARVVPWVDHHTTRAAMFPERQPSSV